MSELTQTSLKHRALNAGMWSLAGFALTMIIRFGSNLVMTRLLMPEAFGVMSIATTVMVGLAMFSDLGLKQFIVQSNRGSDPTYLNTAWTIQILRGGLLWLISVAVSFAVLALARAGLISEESVYASPMLPSVIIALCACTMIAGFSSTRLLEASRSLSLGPLTLIEIVGQVVGLGCMIAWVWIDRSIWSLVAGAIAGTVARTWLSHVWLPGLRNRWEWDRSAAYEILHFGKWIFLASILGFLVNAGDQLLLGGMVNSTVLGLYVIASLYVSAVDGILSKLMGDVSFPAFSEVVRLRPDNLKQHYYQFHRIIASIAYLSAGFLMAFGQTLIGLLYDNRYQASGHILEVIAAVLLTVPFRLATQSFLALGMPKLQSDVILVRLVTLAVLTPIGFHFAGLDGALAGIVFSHFAYIPMIISYNVKHKLFDLRKEMLLSVLAPIGFAVGALLTTVVGHLR